MTESEPEWGDDDRAALLALLAEERETCQGCRNRLSECMDRATEGTWTVEQRICQACRVRDAAMDNAAESKSPARGVKYLVTRTLLTESAESPE